MTKKQLFTIFGVAVVLVVGAALFRSQRRSTWQGQSTGGEVLLPSFPVNDVTAVEITGKSGTVKLERKDDGWRVAQRFDYPAGFSTLKDFMVKISELKAAQNVKVGASQYGRLQLEEPGKGDTSGTKVVFYAKDGKALQTVVFGKEHTRKSDEEAPNPMMGMMGGGGGSWPDGRYLLLPESNRVVLVNDSFSSVDPDPTRWLEKEFFKISDLKDARLTEADQELWSASRDNKTADLKLAGDVPEGKEVDTGKLSSIKTAFSWASFTDVADPAAKPEDTGMDKPKVFAASDFDGFRYSVRIGKETGDSKVHVQVETAFEGATERTPEADEKPEDKQKKDEEFAKKLQENKDKAEQTNRRTKGWTYLVSKYTVDSVTKKRDELLKDKPKPAETKPAEGTTPPATEAKPAEGAPAADATPAETAPPATEAKPAEAAPAPAAEGAPAPAAEAKPAEPAPAPAAEAKPAEAAPAAEAKPAEAAPAPAPAAEAPKPAAGN
jgi:hypothetical protein